LTRYARLLYGASWEPFTKGTPLFVAFDYDSFICRDLGREIEQSGFIKAISKS